MTQPAWITYPQIEDLNSGRTTRDANTRLINNLTAMFGSTPNEFLTTSDVEFGNVTAVTFTGDGTDITGITGVSGGPEQPGNVTVKADSDNDSNGVITLQIFNTPAITINNNRTMIWNSSAITLDQDLNFITSGGVNGFSIDGTTFSVDGANDWVGFGTAVPKRQISVQNSDNTTFVAGDMTTWADTLIYGDDGSDDTTAGIAFCVADLANYADNACGGIAVVKRTGDTHSADMVFITRPAGLVSAEQMRLTRDGRVGIQVTEPTGQLSIDQTSATGAIPVLTLDQGDINEEMIEFISTIGTGNAIEAVAAKSLTTTHFIKLTIPTGTVYMPVGTIA